MKALLVLSGLLSTFVLVVNGAVSTGPLTYRLKESVQPPSDWIKVGRAPPASGIRLRIGLPQLNFDTLERRLYEVSDPYHEHYGLHLSKQEVDSLVAPSKTSIDLVNTWLATHGLCEEDLMRSDAKDWVVVNVSVAVAETMLNTVYSTWRHSQTGEYIIRTTDYSVPEALNEHIEVVQPTTMFARWKPMKSTVILPDQNGLKYSGPANTLDDEGVSCNEVVRLSCLVDLYKTAGYKPQSMNENGIGITGYLEQYLYNIDLRQFFQEYLPEAVNYTYKYHSVNGGLNNQTLETSGLEAALDAEYAFGLSFPTPGTFWSTAGSPPFIPDLFTPTNTNEPYADWLDYVLKQKKIPQTISTSYAEPEQTVPRSYARRVCRGFAQLGARGVSVLFASGDTGVGDGEQDPTRSYACYSNDGKNTTKFLPFFPGTCPFVTAVGGTEKIPEVAKSFSGGGFSEYYPRPSYQEAAVKGYLEQIPEDLYEGLWNRNGRAYPDLSAQSWMIRVLWRGYKITVGGTSASTPIVSAVIALLNDARLAKNKPPLGFLNPLLYSKLASGVNDIVNGTNPGCGTQGFEALPGWDPVTGLGTPDFRAMRKLLGV